MSYRFHRVQCHPEIADLTGWYLEVGPGDYDTVTQLHRGVAHLYFARFGMDPHIKPDSVECDVYNPIKLAAGWFIGIHKYLLAGEGVLVNCNGGLMPLHGSKILETVQRDDLDWPEDLDGEIITIMRWPQGRHFYLSSNRNRVFVPEKFNTFAAARSVALRHVHADKIKSRC